MHTLDPPVVHGNLNAGKLFIDATGTTKIGEFGLAALCYPFAAFVPSVSLVGLSRWLSPEALNRSTEGAPPLTTASDMWALGCTLYEVRTSSPRQGSELEAHPHDQIIAESIPYSNCKHDMQVRRSIRSGNHPGERGDQFQGDPFERAWPLLTECWELNALNRPSALSMLTRVADVLPESGGATGALPTRSPGSLVPSSFNSPLTLSNHSLFSAPTLFSNLWARQKSSTTKSRPTMGLEEIKWIEKVVVFALILDLFAFTLPLLSFPQPNQNSKISIGASEGSGGLWGTRYSPQVSRESGSTTSQSLPGRYIAPQILGNRLDWLGGRWNFPDKLVGWYIDREHGGALLSTILQRISHLGNKAVSHAVEHKWDVVLLRGLMDSLFSSLRFFISPHIGSLSDVYGRKRVLLVSMLAKIAFVIVWIRSTSLASLLLVRAIGGISAGNVQLSIAIITDITPPSHRSRVLMLIAIACSTCSTIGPFISAYFSMNPLPLSLPQYINIYATPSFITLLLLLIATALLAACLPETKGTTLALDGDDGAQGGYKKLPLGNRRDLLKQLGDLHLLFLGLFSGVEFTLIFFTRNVFGWDTLQSGLFIIFLSVVAAVLQGGFIRRVIWTVGEPTIICMGMASCGIALAILSMLPGMVRDSQDNVTKDNMPTAIEMLYMAVLLLFSTSAPVVTSLTVLASLQRDTESSLMEITPLSAPESILDSSSARITAQRKEWARHSSVAHFRGKMTATVVTSDPGSGLRTTNNNAASDDSVAATATARVMITGRAMGKFHSSGQLGLAIGPLLGESHCGCSIAPGLTTLSFMRF